MTAKINVIRVAGILLLFVIGFNAIFAGAALIYMPNGNILGLSSDILKYSPFEDFYVPGICLLLFNGISSIIVALLTINKNKYYTRLITLQGVVLILWLTLQVTFLREANIIQLIMFFAGILLIIVGEYINAEITS